MVDPQNCIGYADLVPGSYVAIAVSDNSGGFPQGVIDPVMDPFFTTKDVGNGTGLGLSMVHGFAEQSGDAVNLYSEHGVGTTIRLYCPAVDDERARGRASRHRHPIGDRRSGGSGARCAGDAGGDRLRYRGREKCRRSDRNHARRKER
jgi:hypothetical protein